MSDLSMRPLDPSLTPEQIEEIQRAETEIAKINERVQKLRKKQDQYPHVSEAGLKAIARMGADADDPGFDYDYWMANAEANAVTVETVLNKHESAVARKLGKEGASITAPLTLRLPAAARQSFVRTLLAYPFGCVDLQMDFDNVPGQVEALAQDILNDVPKALAFVAALDATETAWAKSITAGDREAYRSRLERLHDAFTVWEATRPEVSPKAIRQAFEAEYKADVEAAGGPIAKTIRDFWAQFYDDKGEFKFDCSQLISLADVEGEALDRARARIEHIKNHVPNEPAPDTLTLTVSTTASAQQMFVNSLLSTSQDESGQESDLKLTEFKIGPIPVLFFPISEGVAFISGERVIRLRIVPVKGAGPGEDFLKHVHQKLEERNNQLALHTERHSQEKLMEAVKDAEEERAARRKAENERNKLKLLVREKGTDRAVFNQQFQANSFYDLNDIGGIIDRDYDIVHNALGKALSIPEWESRAASYIKTKPMRFPGNLASDIGWLAWKAPKRPPRKNKTIS